MTKDVIRVTRDVTKGRVHNGWGTRTRDTTTTGMYAVCSNGTVLAIPIVEGATGPRSTDTTE